MHIRSREEMAEFPRLAGLIEVGNAAGVRFFLQPGDNESSPSPVLKSWVGAVGEVLTWMTMGSFKFLRRKVQTT